MSTPIPIWTVFALLAIALVVNWAWAWFRDQYEITWAGRFPRPARRWYATGAHIRSRDMARFPDIYEVLEWGDESTDVPWLCVQALADGDPPREWVPVTAFAAWQVRRFRPHRASGRGWLFAYRPLPGPARIWREKAGA